MKYRALVVREEEAAEDGRTRFVRKVEERDTTDLPSGDLLIRVRYSSLNYKDSLSARGNRGVTRHYPHTPGIDAAGVVAESGGGELREGDEVIVTGFDLGMNTPGGFGQYIRVPSAWALPAPAGLDLRSAMVYGTAGLTAAIAADRLAAVGISPRSGSIEGRLLVTGAKGGVGSLSVALLSHLGFEVEAATGSSSAEDYLRSLGAVAIVPRQTLEQEEAKPLLHARWAAAVDSVGGPILSNLLKAIAYGGAVAACGNAASGSFDGSVYPFILRGVSLLGVDSAGYPLAARGRLWEVLAAAWPSLQGKLRVAECGLGGLSESIEKMTRGEIYGRVVVDLDR